MHELTVALRIREALEAEFADEPDLTAEVVALRVGALSGIVAEALQFARGHAVDGSSLLADSRLEIEWVDVSGRCPSCDAVRAVSNLQSLRCPVCGSPIGEIVGGDELDILTVDVCRPVPETA